MTEIRRLAPHDPVPEGGRHVVVLRRFDEDNPRRIMLEILLYRGGGPPEIVRPVHADGSAASVQETLRLAQEAAAREGLGPIYVVDRLAGAREREILRHGGDHTVNMGQLDDFDLEDGERGPDMRDRHT